MGWIGVKDKVPKFINKKFAVKYEAGNYGETERYSGKQTDEQFKNVLVANGITHWLDESETTPAQSGEELSEIIKQERLACISVLNNVGENKEAAVAMNNQIAAFDICLQHINHINKKIK